MAVESREATKKVKPYIPGKPIEELKRELGITEEILKLASNENPIGASPKALRALRERISETHLYPDDVCYYLKRDISKHLDVAPENLIMGNGSVELILIASMVYLSPEDEFIAGEQSFALGKISAVLMGAKFTGILEDNYTHNLDAIRKAVNEKTKIIYIDNPCNPLGTKISRKDIEDFVYSIPDGILIILDEAYYEFVKGEDFPDSIKFVKENKNVFVLRTFSKIYGLAALRVGYGIAPPEIISTIRKARLPFNVNRLGQIAASAALDDEEHIKKTLEVNDEGKRYLSEAFEKIGVFYIPTSTNFITFKTTMDGKILFKELQKRGIIARPLANYGMPEFIRVTIGTKEQNQRFIRTLNEILSKQGLKEN
jgi:histidinol-phosphate aminotransferase